MPTMPAVVLLCAVPFVAMAQTTESLDFREKLRFHEESVYSPLALAGSAAYAGILPGSRDPGRVGTRGGEAYGKRFASTVAGSAIHAVLALGLDSTLHQDPRYFRSRDTGFRRRTIHAFRGTILTRTDRGGETLSTWRLGSAYGAAFLSNQWYPDRLNTVGLAWIQGSLQLGFDFVSNLGSEFFPDLKRKTTPEHRDWPLQRRIDLPSRIRTVRPAASFRTRLARIEVGAPTACGFGPDPHRRR